MTYGLPYCVTCPSTSTDLKPGYQAKPNIQVVGSREAYEYWGRWQFWQTYLICIIAHLKKNIFTPTVYSFWNSVPEGCHEWQLNVLEGGMPNTHYYPNHDTNTERALKPQFKKFCWDYHLYSPSNTCYQYTLDGKYCTLSKLSDWYMVPIGMRHHGKQLCLLPVL